MEKKKKILKKNKLKKTAKTFKQPKEFTVFLNYLKIYKKNIYQKKLVNFKSLCNEFFDNRISSQLESCMFFIFSYDKQVIQPLLDKNIKVLIFKDSGCFSEEYKQNKIDNEFLKEIYPPKIVNGQNGSFHPKLYFLKFNSFLRIVVGSANLFQSDWDDWNNILWIKDFYVKKGIQIDNENQTNFQEFLNHFVNKVMGDYKYLLKDFLNFQLEDYDLEEDKISLVGSFPSLCNLKENQQRGRRSVNKKETYSQTTQMSKDCVQKYGLQQVKEIMEKNICKKYTFDNLNISYLTSSLGPVSIHFLYEIITSFIPYLRKKSSLDLTENEKKKILNCFKIIYPTEEYVRTSQNGYNKVPLFFRMEYFDSIRFEQDVLHKYEGRNKYDGDNGVLSHCKILVATKDNKIDDDTIIYIGSHNFTKAAWGKYIKNYQQYALNNYELGILYPPRKNSQKEKSDIIKNFNFKFPAEKYDEDDYPFLNGDQKFEQFIFIYIFLQFKKNKRVVLYKKQQFVQFIFNLKFIFQLTFFIQEIDSLITSSYLLSNSYYQKSKVKNSDIYKIAQHANIIIPKSKLPQIVMVKNIVKFGKHNATGQSQIKQYKFIYPNTSNNITIRKHNDINIMVPTKTIQANLNYYFQKSKVRVLQTRINIDIPKLENTDNIVIAFFYIYPHILSFK